MKKTSPLGTLPKTFKIQLQVHLGLHLGSGEGLEENISLTFWSKHWNKMVQLKKLGHLKITDLDFYSGNNLDWISWCIFVIPDFYLLKKLVFHSALEFGNVLLRKLTLILWSSVMSLNGCLNLTRRRNIVNDLTMLHLLYNNC